MQAVNAADDVQLAVGQCLGQQAGLALEPRHSIPDILRNSVVEEIAGCFQHRVHGWFERTRQALDLAGERGVVGDGLDAGRNGATAVMPQHQDQWGVQHRDGVFEAGEPVIGDEVARDAH